MKKLNTRLDEAMSVTLRPSKSQPGSFKVHSVGSKMKAHGGIKPGERVKDHHIDDFHDSGIKVKYHKENVVKESEAYYAMKRAEKHASDDGHDFHKLPEYDRGKDKPHKEKYRAMAQKSQNEAIERRADRKTIIATDPTTGRKVIKVAPKKEIDIGKGKIESVEPSMNELSDKTKLSYIDKRNKQITDKEKLHLNIGAKVDKDKNLSKMRKGVAMAKSKLGEEENVNEISNELVKKVAHKRAVNTSMELSKAHGDTRSPDFKSAADKQKKNSKLRFSRGATQIGRAMKKTGVGEGYKQDFKRNELEFELGHETKKPAAKKPHRFNGVDDATKRAFMRSKPPMGRLRREETVSELKINTMKTYQSAAAADMNDQENARHKNYPEKQIDARQAKREKGIRTADKRIAKKQVKMAKGVAFDKRYKGGNMTGASKAIDKIKPGLSDHPKVKAALQRANEEFKLGE